MSCITSQDIVNLNVVQLIETSFINRVKYFNTFTPICLLRLKKQTS